MPPSANHRSELQRIAQRALAGHGLRIGFAASELTQLDGLQAPAHEEGEEVRDLRGLPWCSITGEDAQGLDQLTAALDMGTGSVRVFVAIPDVDAWVGRGSPIDEHAAHNAVSVYAAGLSYPLLPDRLSADLTSFGPGMDRLSVVVEFVVRKGGSVAESEVSRGVVRSYAKLGHRELSQWLDGQGPVPEAVTRAKGMEDQVRLQDVVAARLRQGRHDKGGLDLFSSEVHTAFRDDQVLGLHVEGQSRARELVEEMMIASHGVVARFLKAKGRLLLRRVVHWPECWAKLVELAARHGESLPGQPSTRALRAFLLKRRVADAQRFADLSFVLSKIVGAGAYIAEEPGESDGERFALVALDPRHGTLPNSRFSDLVMQRLLKAALADLPSPYGIEELHAIARHCSRQERTVAKVERQVRKSAAAILLESRVGETFDGIVTGAADKGTWVRVLDPPVEGRLTEGSEGLRVGDTVRATLLSADFERGHLDFASVRAPA